MTNYLRGRITSWDPFGTTDKNIFHCVQHKKLENFGKYLSFIHPLPV